MTATSPKGTPTLALASVALVLISVLAPLVPVAAADPEFFIAEIPGTRRPLSPGSFDLFLSDDMVTSAMDLGFTTRFFDEATNLFWVGSNGFVTLHFLTPDGCCEGPVLPTPGGPDGVIAGWWTDLDPSSGGNVRVDRTFLDGQPALIVDYDQVPVLGSTGTATFQIVLFRSGVFEVLLEDVTAPAGGFASVGAENINGQRGVTQLRVQDARIQNVGFRFTPNVPPSPPPTITSVSPSAGSPGSFATVFGTNFTPGASVSLGGFGASTFFQGSSQLGFFVPFLSPGVFDVTVTNPDGNATTLPQAFEIVANLDVFGVVPNVARQSDVVTVQGSAFTQAVTVLLDGVPMESTLQSGSEIRVRLPRDLPLGRYDVAVTDPDRGTFERRDALLVLGRPDLAVRDLAATRPGVSTFATPAVPLPAPWDVRLTVVNQGDLTARDVSVVVTATPRGSGPVLRAEAGLPDLAVGDAEVVRVSLGTGFEVGDYDVVAVVSTHGVADRDPRNDRAETLASAYVSGAGGGTLEPCWHAPRACMGPETRHHVRESREQEDQHVGAALRIVATMAQADFEFANPPVTLTRSTLLPGGGFQDCTTWRFFGDPAGTLRVTMDLGNGKDGFALVPDAANRSSNGTKSTQTWSDQRAFGVILTETERSTTGAQPSDPLTEYVFEDGRSTWSLEASGLRGDFTHCAVRPEGEAGREDFTFAALPENVNAPVGNFDGVGEAAEVVVSFSGRFDSETSAPFL